MAGRLNRRGLRLVMFLDLAAILTIMVGLMLIRFGVPPWPTYTWWAYAISFSVSLAIFFATFYFGGLYEREPRLGAAAVFPRAARLSLGAGAFVVLLNVALTGLANQRGSLIQRVLPFPISNLVLTVALTSLVLVVNRGIVKRLRTRREGPPRIVIAGEGSDIDLARTHLRANSTPVVVTSVVERPEDLLAAVGKGGASDVLLVTSEWLDVLYPHVIDDLGRANVTTLLRVTGKETLFGLDRLREVGGLPFVLLLDQTMPVYQLQFKRLLDIALLLITAPLWLTVLGLLSIYHRLVAGSPLLYRQRRVGKDGQVFEMLKFRSMVVDAEAQGVQLSSGAEDPRVIPALRWMRATRADELPQLLQVARGTMSVVGPRPERPELTADYEREIPGYRRRLEVPPGLTGLAQTHGRYHTDASYKLGYDLQYLVNWSPVLDIEILARTVWVVLTRRV